MAFPLKIAGIALIFCAFFLSFLVSISLPFFRTMDVVKTTFQNNFVKEIRLGIWSFCYYPITGGYMCSPKHHGYALTGFTADDNDFKLVVDVGSSWTRGLAIHPVATCFAFIAFCISFTKRALIATLLAFFAALMTLLAFAVDIALYAKVHHEMADSGIPQENTNTGPGFWLTFVSLLALIAGGVLVLLGKRDNGDYPSYPTYSTGDKKSWMMSVFKRN